jgi:type I restriction enzyme M protein
MAPRSARTRTTEARQPAPSAAALAEPLSDVAPAPDGQSPPDEQRAGYVPDYITGEPVRATPEEIEAVQVFARRLHEDFRYPKARIHTRPQFRVRPRPSEENRARGYPVDIVVFKNERKLEDDAYIIVECKRLTRRDGERQLKLYLSMSSAQIGVWFNGREHLYLLKRHLPDGSLDWTVLPSLPRADQDIADIGSLTRGQLAVPSNLKAVFRDIRNYLAGNATGITRDQELAQEIMSVLLCKIHDELDTAPSDVPRFRTGAEESAERVAGRIRSIFADVKREYPDVFRETDDINLDIHSLQYVVGELQGYEIVNASRDAIGEAFEVFIGPAVRGEEGQFFTPRNVVEMMVELIDPEPGEMLIDPACGSGGFLVVALQHVWKKLEREAAVKGWSDAHLESKKKDVARRTIRGIDKDGYLTRLTKAYMAIIRDGRGGIFTEDGLAEPAQWSAQTRDTVRMGTFDIVITNPPFGSKIKVTGTHKLAQYSLARKWRAPRRPGEDWQRTETLHTDQPPQVLFIERCIQLLKPGGRLAIVLPESIFGMPVYGYVVKYLYENYRLRAFVSLPEEVFQPSTHAKTCVVILENSRPREDDEIEMAIADWCGHDSRGNPTIRVGENGEETLLDDLPKIAEHLKPRLPWR